MSGKIFIAAKDAFFEPPVGNPIDTDREHAYLVFDADGSLDTPEDQFFISGYPQEEGTTSASNDAGQLRLQIGFSYQEATDSLDQNHDDIFELRAEDRNYRLVSSATNADIIWQQMKAFAMSLWDGQTTLPNGKLSVFEYHWNTTNSNSLAATILNSVGLNFRLLLPLDEGDSAANVGIDLDGMDPLVPDVPGDFPGHTEILDGNLDSTFTAYAYDEDLYTILDDDLYTFWDNKGNDTIIVENGARLRIVKDDDALSTNRVVLQDFTLAQLSLNRPPESTDLFINSSQAFSDPVLELKDQYGANGTAAGVLEVWEGAIQIKRINLSVIPDVSVFGFGSLNNIYTAFAGAPDITGTSNDDYIFGTSAANTLTGGRGFDRIEGRNHNDTLYGGIPAFMSAQMCGANCGIANRPFN